ncbi:MAG: hypothetical protein ACJ8GN_31610 [Longimicrobiaceae bacterium]
MRRPAFPLLAALALAGWGPAACQRGAPAPAPPCAEVQGALPAEARADGLAGDFGLTLVATRGARTGARATGSLHLRRNDAGAGPAPSEGVRYPLVGWAEAPVDSVGAVAPGDVGSREAARPGVLAVEERRAGRTQLILRFGAEANRGVVRFDGAYLVLTPAALTADGFAGRWNSGVGGQTASGYFCAHRTN